MATVSSKRRSDLALRPEDRVDFDLLVWFACYTHDPDFCAALETLSLEHRNILHLVMDDLWYQRYLASALDDPRAKSFIHAVLQFEQEWQLDRLNSKRGDTAIWLWMKARGQRVVYPDWLNLPSDGEWSPQFFGNSTPIRYSTNAEPDIDRNEDEKPIVRLGENYWDPQTERPQPARKRLERESRRAIAAEMDRIARAYEASGQVLEDSKVEAQNYPRWAYRRFVKDEHFSEIADSACVAPASVRLRTNEFAKRIGFDFPRTRRRSER